MTLQQMYIKSLVHMGFKQTNTRSTRYLLFTKEGRKVFLGERGAIRLGETVANSRACSEEFKKNLLVIYANLPQEKGKAKSENSL